MNVIVKFVIPTGSKGFCFGKGILHRCKVTLNFLNYKMFPKKDCLFNKRLSHHGEHCLAVVGEKNISEND